MCSETHLHEVHTVLNVELQMARVDDWVNWVEALVNRYNLSAVAVPTHGEHHVPRVAVVVAHNWNAIHIVQQCIQGGQLPHLRACVVLFVSKD